MRLFFALAFFPVLLSAQPDFLKDPDIVWAVEIEQDWEVDIPLETEWEEGITTLKLLCEDRYELYIGPPNLSALVTNSAALGDLEIFKDAGCTIRTDWRSVLSVSDNHTFDPETQEEIVTIRHPHYDPDMFKKWRLRQVLAYDQKSARWSTTVGAVAPLIDIRNENGDSIGTRPVFWFQPENNRQNLRSNHIVWAKRTVNKQPKTQIPIVDAPLLKSAANFPGLLSEIRSVVEHRMEIPLYHGTENRLLGPEERQKLIARVDTIYGEQVNGGSMDIVRWDILDQVKNLRLVQTWYWDKQRNRLSICLDAVAPLREVSDDAGNYRFTVPLFYRRTRK